MYDSPPAEAAGDHWRSPPPDLSVNEDGFRGRSRSRSPPGQNRPPLDSSRSPPPRRKYSRSRSPVPPPLSSRLPPPKPRHAPNDPQPTNVVGVFGLSIRTVERDLEDEFSRFGRVEKATIVYDQRSLRSRGFGFVTMEDVDGATRAIKALNGIELHGRRLRVDYSVTKRPHDPTPGEYMGNKRGGDFDTYRRPPPRGGYDSYGGRGLGYDRDRSWRERSPIPRRRSRSPPRRRGRYSPSPSPPPRRRGYSPPPRSRRSPNYGYRRSPSYERGGRPGADKSVSPAPRSRYPDDVPPPRKGGHLDSPDKDDRHAMRYDAPDSVERAPVGRSYPDY